MNPAAIDPKAWVAISQAVAEQVWLIDNGLADRAIELYAQKTRLEFAKGSPMPAVYEGRAAVAEFLIARAEQRDKRSRHIVSNIRMAPQQDGRIAVTSAMLLFKEGAATSDTDVAFVADIEEEYVQEADGVWRIADRVIKPVFKAGAK